MSKSKKLGPFKVDLEVQYAIAHLKPEFGNMRHVAALEAWGKLGPLYARKVKGIKTRDAIASLESEIRNALIV